MGNDEKFIFTNNLSTFDRTNYICCYIYKKLGTGTTCKEKFRKEKFQTEFVVAGGGFLSYWNHQLIKFEEEKRFEH